MNRDRTMPTPPKTPRRFSAGVPLLAGTMLGLMFAAGWTAFRNSRPALRRYTDHAPERRSPLSLFTAGDHPRRRKIDQSGSHPLFERRQDVYDAY